MLKKVQGGSLEACSRLCLSGLFLVTFATSGIPHAGSQQWTTDYNSFLEPKPIKRDGKYCSKA